MQFKDEKICLPNRKLYTNYLFKNTLLKDKAIIQSNNSPI